MLKRILAILLVIGMLAGVSSFAEPAAQEVSYQEAFMAGIASLLKSFSPADRDKMNLTVSQQGMNLFDAQLWGNQELAALKVSVPPRNLDAEVQISSQAAYVAAQGQVIGLKYEDVPAIMEAVSGALLEATGLNLDLNALSQIDPQVLTEIGQLFLQKVLLKNLQMIPGENSIRISFKATGKELLANLGEFVDQLLAEEKYRPVLEPVWAVVSMLVAQQGGEVPTLEQVVAMWPQLKEQLNQVETDLAVALDLDMANDYSSIDLSGEIGVPQDKYMMNWAWRMDKSTGKISLVGKLTERITRTTSEGEQVRDYDIDIVFDGTVMSMGAMWTLTVNYPYGGFNLKLDGNHLGTMGNVSMEMVNQRSRNGKLTARVDYSFTGNGGSLTVTWADQRANGGTVKLNVERSNLLFDVTVTSMGRSQQVLCIEARADENDKVAYLSVITPTFSAVYDGTELVIESNGVKVHCVGEFVSEKEYQITMTPEGIEDTRPAYIRLTYDGEEGNWFIKLAVIDPEGTEAVSVDLVCAPTEPVDLLSEKENLMMITPEVAVQLVMQVYGQAMRGY